MRTLTLALILPVAAAAAVLDRVAVVVGTDVITATEVEEEVRMTEFLNGQPLDLSPAARRAAADRLVDQQLIRNDMTIGNYPKPDASEAAAMLRQFKQEHFRSDAEYRAALQQYGVSEQQLKDHLLWQLAAMRFTDLRFGAALPSAPNEASREAGVDQQMEQWLKEARSRTRIEFKKEAFQ